MNDIIEIHEEKKDRGFTLIELLIVIVILGILATVTVFAVRGITDQGQDSACEATQKTYQVAIEAWYAGGENTAGTDHPTGADLVASGLIREYVSTDVEVIVGTGTAATAVSTVGATTGGNCVGRITTS